MKPKFQLFTIHTFSFHTLLTQFHTCALYIRGRSERVSGKARGRRRSPRVTLLTSSACSAAMFETFGRFRQASVIFGNPTTTGQLVYIQDRQVFCMG